MEPEVAMRKVALRNAKKRRISNVKFIRGKAEKIPIEDNSVDVVTCFTGLPYPRSKIPKFVSEATRVVRDGGSIAIVEIPPNWYGGELASIIGDNAEDLVQVDRILSDHGFGYKDTFTIQKFRSVKKAVDTFGFIFGRKAIGYLISHNKNPSGTNLEHTTRKSRSIEMLKNGIQLGGIRIPGLVRRVGFELKEGFELGVCSPAETHL